MSNTFLHSRNATLRPDADLWPIDVVALDVTFRGEAFSTEQHGPRTVFIIERRPDASSHGGIAVKIQAIPIRPMAGRSLFPSPSIITSWTWDANLECPTEVPVRSEQANLVTIQEDTESILFRTIKLKKAPAAPPPKPKKPVPNIIQEANTTFLPAPIHKMTIAELKQALKSIGMSTKGSWAELEQRLEKMVGGDKK